MRVRALGRHKRRRIQLLIARSRIAPVLATVLLTAGCWGDPIPSKYRIGVSKDDTGKVTVVYNLCPGEAIRRVELDLTDHNVQRTLSVVWVLSAEGGGSTRRTFTVGQVPSGFREVTQLSHALKPKDHVQIVVTSTQRAGVPMTFQVGDIRNGSVLTWRSRYQSRRQFDQSVRKACKRP